MFIESVLYTSLDALSICANKMSLITGHYFYYTVANPLSPHDAIMHHFTSLKIQFISLKLRVLKGKFPYNWYTNKWQFSIIF